jgi:hypothetical protein
MRMLDEAGIYLALDANTPEYSLNRESLDSLHASYNDVYLQSVFATIDNFAGYSMNPSDKTLKSRLIIRYHRQSPTLLLR